MVKNNNSNYQSLAKLDPMDFIAITDVLALNGEKVSKRKKQWITMLINEKLNCAATGDSIAYLSYDILEHKKLPPTYHFNFYTEEGELVTVDHIKPKSLGGSEMDGSNLQPMIGIHNWRKGLNYQEKI